MVMLADKRGAAESSVDAVEFELGRYVGSVIGVVWTTKPLKRTGFHTAISVSGELECCERDGVKCFRVVISDGTYAYFTADNLEGFVIKETKCGEEAVVYIVA